MKTPQTLSRFLLLIVGALAWAIAGSAQANYLSLYAFGDSLSDAGNAYTLSYGLIPPSPPYDHRFSNGPVAVEQLATDLGISGFHASLLSPPGGTDYAVAGADTGRGNYSTISLPGPLGGLLANTGMATQVGGFVSAAPAFNPATTLFFLWGGANDIFTALDTNANLTTAVTDAIRNLSIEIAALASIGADHFLVPNLPDLGVTPFGLSSGYSSGLSALSASFDTGLSWALTGLQSRLGLDIRQFDVFGFMNKVIGDPSAFGFTNVTDPCLNGLTVCADPSQYLFWDSVHPTTSADAILAAQFRNSLDPTAAANSILAAGFASSVPEPTTIALVGVGLLGLGFSRRKRKV